MQYRRNANNVERKIHFFRAYIGSDESGEPLPFDPSPALNRIANLSFSNDDAGRYEFDTDGNALCLLDHRRDRNLLVRFCRVRRTGLPQLEQAGQISDLDLDSDSGLLETIHVVFFSDNIVGAEYNHFGPRLSRLGIYLHEKSEEAVDRAVFHPLLRADAAQQLDRLAEIRLLDLSIHPAYAEALRQIDLSLGDAFAANARLLDNPKTVQVVVKPQERSRQAALHRFLAPIRRLLGQSDLLLNTERLQLRERCRDTDRVETIDLLKDQVISTKSIVRLNERSRALAPDSAFQAICEAYDDLAEHLQTATGMSS